MSANNNHHTCPICHQHATNRCSRCKSAWYCSVEHQRQHWKVHKPVCCDDDDHAAAAVSTDAAQQQQQHKADQLTLHKQEFDRIIQHYQLNTEEKSEEIANFLTTQQAQQEGAENTVSATEFAEKFGMKMEEAVVFLEWIKVGIKFKEESIDTAKKAGLGKR